MKASESVEMLLHNLSDFFVLKPNSPFCAHIPIDKKEKIEINRVFIYVCPRLKPFQVSGRRKLHNCQVVACRKLQSKCGLLQSAHTAVNWCV